MKLKPSCLFGSIKSSLMAAMSGLTAHEQTH
jgi:hypothetical protein